MTRRSLDRGGRIAALVVLGAWALYIVVANAILWTSLPKWLSKDELQMYVAYKHAWTVIPGRVVVDNFALRFQDRNIQFLLGIDRATMQIDLTGLARRRFRVTHITADGVTYRARHKLESKADAKERAAAFPPIPGYADPPVKSEDDKTPKPPIPDSEYALWEVALDDVSATVRELWILEYRYRGPAAVAGGFRLRPRRELAVTPSVFVSHGGALAIGDREIVVRSKGRIEAKIDPFDVREPKGLEVLHQIDATIDLDGDLVSIAPFGATYLVGTGVGLEEGAGRLAFHARANKGILDPETHIECRTDHAVVTTAKATIAASIVARADVARPKEKDEDLALVAGAEIATATITPAGGAKPAIAIAGAKVKVDLGNADLAGAFRLAALSGEIASAKAPDLRPLQSMIPPGLQLHGGGVIVSGKASYANDAIDGRIDATLERADIAAGPFAMKANGKAWIELASRGPKKSALTAGLVLGSSSLLIEGTPANDIWIDARIPDGTASFTAAPGLDAAISLRAGPGDRVLHLAGGLASVPSFVTDAAAGPELQSSARIHTHGSSTTFELLGAKDGVVESRGAIAKSKDRVKGAFLVSVGVVRTGIELEDGDTSVTPAAGPEWLESKTGALRQR